MSATKSHRHHIDKRAASVLATETDSDDDELLTGSATADWLGVSEQWLELGRTKKYGPKFVRLSPRMVRYRRGDVRAWLKRRTHQSTAEYT